MKTENKAEMSTLRNGHMNIFAPFSAPREKGKVEKNNAASGSDESDEKAARMIENNLSRSLAIIFEEYSSVLEGFLNFVNGELNKAKAAKIKFPQNKDYGIYIQANVETYAQYCNKSNICLIGTTLTVDADMDENANVYTEKPIPDIYVRLSGENDKETIILIEVKRGSGEDTAQAQVNDQLEKLKEAIKKQNSSSKIDIKIKKEKEIVNVKWEDVIGILKNNQEQDGRKCRIISDYLEIMELDFPGWFPVELFSADMTKAQFDNRKNRLCSHVYKKHTSEEDTSEIPEEAKGRIHAPKKYKDIANWVDIRSNYDGNNKLESIAVVIQLADTSVLSRKYFIGYPESRNARGNLAWLANEVIEVDGKKYSMNIKPYLSFWTGAGGRAPKFSVDFDENWIDVWNAEKKCADHWKDLCRSVCRKWKKKEWDKLKNTIQEKFGQVIDFDKFKNDFSEDFEKTPKVETSVGLGIYVKIAVDLCHIAKLDNDKDTNLNKEDHKENVDKVAALIMEVSKEFFKQAVTNPR